MGMSASGLNNSFLVMGLADAFTRILLAVKGHLLKNNLTICYLGASFIGFFISIFWSRQNSITFNRIYCICKTFHNKKTPSIYQFIAGNFIKLTKKQQVFGVCPAVCQSLMYSVNSEISGQNNIQKNYTINVMISGIGIIMGPILSGIQIYE